MRILGIDYGDSRVGIAISDPLLITAQGLMNITGTAKGITVRGAKYPLENAEISCEYQYGVSNEVLKGKRATVSVEDGKLLLIKIR